jgi:hypothetical protein
VGSQAGIRQSSSAVEPGELDTDLAAMLVWGVVER